MKTLLILVFLVIVAGIVGWFALNREMLTPASPESNSGSDTQISSFEDCVEAGHPIQESYPRRCTVPDGETFTEDVEEIEENENQDIIVDMPQPNSEVNSPLEVNGEVIGSWYFEGTFTAELHDETGQIGSATIEAEEDWMTESRVPFAGEIEFDEDMASGEGELILRNANPSGLPENEETFTVPVSF